MFKVIKKEGHARRGEFQCAHGGVVQTPVFMNVGTVAAIKGGVDGGRYRQLTRRTKRSGRGTGGGSTIDKAK